MNHTNENRSNQKKKNENVVYFRHVTAKRKPFGQPDWSNVNHQEWARGLEHGFELGIEEVAKRMLRSGIDISFVARITELSRQRVFELKLNLAHKGDR